MGNCPQSQKQVFILGGYSDFVSGDTEYKIAFCAQFTGLGICQIVMEILGIVWAASIICPASTATESTQGICALHIPPHESLLAGEIAEWQESLQQIYDWATSIGLETPESDVPQLGTLHSQPNLVAQEPSFQALVPSIGVALSSFEFFDAPAAPITSPAAATHATVVESKWQDWSAVAAVRIEPPLSPSQKIDFPTHSHEYCLPETSTAYQAIPSDLQALPKQQVWVHNQFIGEVAGDAAAQKIATKLRTLIQSGQLQAAHLSPFVGQNFVGVSHDQDLLFVVDEALQPHPEVPAAVTAVQWVNNLRTALNEAPMSLGDIQMALTGLTETSTTLYGMASWYGPHFHGRQTANGEIFDENALTAAHKTLPFNTQLKVTNRMNGQSVVVRINDRGPYIGQRSLDLSKAAAHCLGSTQDGVVPYEAVILEPTTPTDAGELTTAQLPLE